MRLLVTTGRTLYQFHTRTKTGRTPPLHDATPDVWFELCPEDATTADVTEGNVIRVESAGGSIEGPVRIARIRPGAVFIPFHYGSWDADDRSNGLSQVDGDGVHGCNALRPAPSVSCTGDARSWKQSSA